MEDNSEEDGERSLVELCGHDYERLQQGGWSARKLWTTYSLQEVRNLFPGKESLAAQVFDKFSLVVSVPRWWVKVENNEVLDHERLLHWVRKRLNHVSSLRDPSAAFHVLMLRGLEELVLGKMTGNTERERLHNEREMEVSMESLRRKYVGDAHRVLYKRLCSGTGKTRGVMQMSHLGVYVCYCSTAPVNSSACPPRTGDLANLLIRTNDEFRMALYFRAWLLVLHKKVKDGRMSSVQWMESQRDSVDIVNDVYQTWVGSIEATTPDTNVTDLDLRNEKLLEPAMEELKHVQMTGEQVQVLFVFDEGCGLLPSEENNFGLEESPFYQMRRVARVFFKYKNCFAVVMDTIGRVSNLQPTRGEDRSRRATILGLDLLPPIYQVFNMQIVTPTCDLSPKSLFRYGRPLWSSRLDCDQSLANLVCLAAAKLVKVSVGVFQGKQVDVYGARGDVKMVESQALALLSASAGLEICPQSAQSQLLVASHMSILTLISEDRARVHISQPVEPVVSEAALKILNGNNGRPLEVALNLFLGGCQNGYVTAGHRGEFIVKVILLQALQRFYDGHFYLRRLPLRDYLLELLGWGMPQVDEVCSGLDTSACVFFNGYMLVKQGVLRPEVVAAAFMRGRAIIMFKADNTVKGYDIAIPVWTPKGMTLLLVSVKNTKNSGWLNKASTTALKRLTMKLKGFEEMKVVTVLINVQEAKVKMPAATKLWKEGELHESYGEYTNNVAHVTVYGLQRNFGFLSVRTRQLLIDLSIAVPDTETEAKRQQGEALSWLQSLLPDTYRLRFPKKRDIMSLGKEKAEASSDALEEDSGGKQGKKRRKRARMS